MEDQKLYVCESCGQTTPVDNDACTNCGGKMVLLDDDVEPNPEDLDDAELDEKVGMTDEFGTHSLEELASKEQDESDEDYRHDSFDDE